MTMTKTQCRQIRGVIAKMMTGPTLRIEKAPITTWDKLRLEDEIKKQYQYWASMYVMNELNGMLPENEKMNFAKPTT